MTPDPFQTLYAQRTASSTWQVRGTATTAGTAMAYVPQLEHPVYSFAQELPHDMSGKADLLNGVPVLTAACVVGLGRFTFWRGLNAEESA